ncbi:IS66 C-terminal element [Pseudomonas borbori]|uniref:IS66 C-terminal element n=1 Tax=Pseudomonas borbori TaxID=289003 RepID=A0A1I5XDP3_9PSED|nr:IS66 C-terminal element [Pseudomonas borbori]
MAPAHSAPVTNSQLNNMVETAKATGQEPYAGLLHVFEHLPLASRVEDYEMLLPAAVELSINGSTVKRKAPPREAGVHGVVTVDQYTSPRRSGISLSFPQRPNFSDDPVKKYGVKHRHLP